MSLGALAAPPGHLKLADFGTAKRLQARCLPPLLYLHYNLLLVLHLLLLHLLLHLLHLPHLLHLQSSDPDAGAAELAIERGVASGTVSVAQRDALLGDIAP